MVWIEVTDNFSVFSVRTEFQAYIDWIFYFLSVYWLYFLYAIALTLMTIILITISMRLKKFSEKVDRQ